MMKATDRSLQGSILAQVMAASSSVLIMIGGANAAPPSKVLDCSGGGLQTAIDRAKDGATLTLSGTCTGNFIINKSLSLVPASGQTVTLNGNGTESVLRVESPCNRKGVCSQIFVTLQDIEVTNGSSNYGGGIFVRSHSTPASVLMLYGSTSVHGNFAFAGGGIYNDRAEVRLYGSASVYNNEGSV